MKIQNYILYLFLIVVSFLTLLTSIVFAENGLSIHQALTGSNSVIDFRSFTQKQNADPFLSRITELAKQYGEIINYLDEQSKTTTNFTTPISDKIRTLVKNYNNQLEKLHQDMIHTLDEHFSQKEKALNRYWEQVIQGEINVLKIKSIDFTLIGEVKPNNQTKTLVTTMRLTSDKYGNAQFETLESFTKEKLESEDNQLRAQSQIKVDADNELRLSALEKKLQPYAPPKVIPKNTIAHIKTHLQHFTNTLKKTAGAGTGILLLNFVAETAAGSEFKPQVQPSTEEPVAK